MSRLPFKENRLSVESYEIILLDRKFPPNMKHVAIMLLIVAVISGLGALQSSGSWQTAGWLACGVFVIGFLAFPLLYYLHSNQLWVPTAFIANIDSLRGYVQGPGPWFNALTETPLTRRWGQVQEVAISHRPWIYAMEKVELDVLLRDGTSLTYRLPRLADDEQLRLAQVLEAIGKRQDFQVTSMPLTEKPRLVWPLH